MTPETEGKEEKARVGFRSSMTLAMKIRVL
jgi:hypothetical protein